MTDGVKAAMAETQLIEAIRKVDRLQGKAADFTGSVNVEIHCQAGRPRGFVVYRKHRSEVGG